MFKKLFSSKQETDLEEKLDELGRLHGILSWPRHGELIARALLFEQSELIERAKHILAQPVEHQIEEVAERVKVLKLVFNQPPDPILTPVHIKFSFQDEISGRAFGNLERCLSESLWPQRTECTEHPSYFVHVVAMGSCRLELGQELSSNRMKEILVNEGQNEVFVLALHFGVNAPPIQFSSHYGDRIKIGQVVYTEKEGSLKLVENAEDTPLSACKSKLAAFFQNGRKKGEESSEVDSRNERKGNESPSELREPASIGTSFTASPEVAFPLTYVEPTGRTVSRVEPSQTALPSTNPASQGVVEVEGADWL